LSGRVVSVAEEGLLRRVFARLLEAPQQSFDPPPPVPADHRARDLVAEDEAQDSGVAGVRFDRLLHRGPGLGCHLLPASPVGGVQIPRVVPPNPHKELQPRLLGKLEDL
jgi:hypothetical protein